MASVPEVRVVRVLDLEQAASPTRDDPPTAVSSRPAEPPRQSSRVSPIVLVGLALLAGAGAIALGALAVVEAGEKGEPAVVEPVATSERDLRQALLLLAKPSTERVPFERSGGSLVLAVGSGGRAALVLRGFAPAPAGKTFHAWVFPPRGAARHAAAFTGSQPVVPLDRPVTVGSSVVVSSGRQSNPAPPSKRGLVARRSR